MTSNLGSASPGTLPNSENRVPDDETLSESAQGNGDVSPRYSVGDEEDELDENSLFPSARADPAVAASKRSPSKVQDSSEIQDEDDGASNDQRTLMKKRRSTSSFSSSQERTDAAITKKVKRHLDDSSKPTELTIAKRRWSHNIVHKATFQENSIDRTFRLENDESSDCQMEFYPGSALSNELLEDLLALTRDNMKAMYDGSGSAAWAWNDSRKRGELRNDRMRWILLRSKTLPGIDTPESGSKGIVGFMAFRFVAEAGIPLAYLHELQLSKSVQRMGYGQRLTAQLERIARNCSMQLIMLTVFSSNVTAMKFYEKLGFSIDEASPGPCYNLMDDDQPKSPYEIMSKVLDAQVLGHGCPKCSYRCRFQDTLQQHAGFKHGEPWPFPCKIPGCNGGTVHAHQLQRHTEIKHCATVAPAIPPISNGSAAAMSETTSESSSTAAEQNYVNMRVTLQSDGRKGTVVKLGEKGFYTVRMDGPMLEMITCRASAFVGHQSVPVKKKERDPDYEFALQLQYEDGWARKSSRLNKRG